MKLKVKKWAMKVRIARDQGSWLACPCRGGGLRGGSTSPGADFPKSAKPNFGLGNNQAQTAEATLTTRPSAPFDAVSSSSRTA